VTAGPFTGDGPRVFASAPGADMARDLAAGMRARLAGAPPQALAQVMIALNTRRGLRAARTAFEAAGPSVYLPRLMTLDDLVEHPLLGAEGRAVDPERRRLTLTRLVRRFLERNPGYGPPGAAPALAEALGRLIDETGREGAATDGWDGLVPEALGDRWRRTLAFMSILREAWPAILRDDEGGAMEAEARRRRAMERVAELWAADPPGHPVIAAGSTGSRHVTALFLRAAARAPQGAVILPGFDPQAAARVWSSIDESHPWSGMKRLLVALEIDPEAVPFWIEPDPATAPRRRLVAEALRPAPVTDAWLAAAPALREDAPAALDGLTVIEAEDGPMEAEAVARLMRAAIAEPGRRVALISPDRRLTRRVTAALARAGLSPDDSGGRPLALTPPGVFLKLLAECAFAPFDAVALLALLKHPFCAAGPGRGAHRRDVAAFELRVLRAAPGLASLEAARAAAARLTDPPLAGPVAGVLDALAALAATPPRLPTLAAAHRDLAGALSGGEVWAREAGAAARAACDALVAAADAFGDAPAADYPILFAAGLTGAVREEPWLADPRIAIWGPLEARMQRADLVILGGLNEGVWPAQPDPDPWMNRTMRAAAGLPPPERATGLAAHDVLNAACAPRVALTRARRDDEAPTTPSRWLARLATLAGGVDADAWALARARGDAVLVAARAARAAPPLPAAPRPAPRPPVGSRPRKLSVTQIETLVRDPFAVYAREVLRLRPLRDLAEPLDARDRGIALHAALAALTHLPLDGPDAIAAAYDAAVATALRDSPATAAQRALWAARMARAKPRFVAEEAARRAAGAPLPGEIRGAREDAALAFRLTAQADRIDRLRDGSLAIYDVKTGKPPTDRQVGQFAKQLPLEAAIAQAGGFEGLAAAPVSRLAYIGLDASLAGGAQPLKDDPQDLGARSWAELLALIASYDDPARPYPPRARHQKTTDVGDYDHLARFGEWRDGDPAESPA